MYVDQADAVRHQPVLLDQRQNLIVSSARSCREPLEKTNDFSSIPKVATRQLTDDEWMNEHTLLFEQLDEDWVDLPQMIDPDRCIDEDQRPAGFRRGMADRSGSVPPSRARRRALSLDMSARRPS